MNTIKLDDPFSKYPVKPKPLTDKSDRSEGDGEEGGGEEGLGRGEWCPGLLTSARSHFALKRPDLKGRLFAA